MNKPLQDLYDLKIINNITNLEKLNNIIIKKNRAVYCGFDPSASSLHLGNYIQLNILKRLHKLFNFTPIVIIGKATALIGDPSGKKSERILKSEKEIFDNSVYITKQIKKIIPNAIILNNYDWLKNISLVDLLRDYGKDFNVNNMISKETIKNRLDAGISFTEFTYSILQSIDFLYLYKNYDCYLQIGGSDQWGNITSGINYIKKKVRNSLATGLTFNLLTKNNGEKFGKTEEGTVWLDSLKTSNYQLYQFLYNQPDDQLKLLFAYLTTFDNKKIDEIIKLHVKKPWKRYGQITLAKEVITQLHTENDFVSSEQISDAFFNNKIKSLSEKQSYDLFGSFNKITISEKDLLLDILKKNKVTNGNTETRRFIDNKNIRLNDDIVTDYNYTFLLKNAICNKYFLLKIGKKKFFLLSI